MINFFKQSFLGMKDFVVFSVILFIAFSMWSICMAVWLSFVKALGVADYLPILKNLIN